MSPVRRDSPTPTPTPSLVDDDGLLSPGRFQSLPYVVLDAIAYWSGSPQLGHAQRKQFALPQPARAEKDLFCLGETCTMMAIVTRRMRFHTLRIDNCAVDDDRMDWLIGQEDLLSYVRQLVVGSKGLSGCRCPSKSFRRLVSYMTQLEHLEYRSKRPLSPGLAKDFARLENLSGVFICGTGFTSSPALSVFKNLKHLVLFPESLGVLPPPAFVSADVDAGDAWLINRRRYDTRAISRCLAQSCLTLEQLYIAFGYEREGDEARRIFAVPSAETDPGCGGDQCIALAGETGTLAFPRLKQLFLRTSDLSASFFPDLLLGAPRLMSLWITHVGTSHSSRFVVPVGAVPDLVELNVNLPELVPADLEGLRHLVRGKRALRNLVLGEQAPLDVLFENASDGADVKSFSTWSGVNRELLAAVGEKLLSVEELSFEGSTWADEDLKLTDVPSYLSPLKNLRVVELPCPLLPEQDINPTFQQYLHEMPFSRGAGTRPDPWLEAAALSLFKTHLPAMMPAVRAFAEQTAVRELVLSTEHTEWRWTIGADDVELRMCFRPVMGGEIFGGGFLSSKEDAWSLGRIVTTHAPRPAADASTDGPQELEPAVEILFDDDKAAHTGGQIWHAPTPANEVSDEDCADQAIDAVIVRRGGSNCRTATLMTGQVTAWHRTSSLDYNIVTFGPVTLLTPRVPTTPADWPPSALRESHPDILETVVEVGEVVVQRGTVHAWRNDTDHVVRWTAVLTDAAPLHGLPDVWVEEGEGGKGAVREHKPFN